MSVQNKNIHVYNSYIPYLMDNQLVNQFVIKDISFDESLMSSISKFIGHKMFGHQLLIGHPLVIHH